MLGRIRFRSAGSFSVRITFILVLLSHLVPRLSLSIPFLSKTTLYDPATDYVALLNGTNFQTTVFHSDRTWLVEFYSSWCGHCINFAPKWKQFGADLRDWRSIVVIAGIDCADEANIPTCRDFEIMGYPTLKIFPKGSKRQILDAGGKNLILNTGTVFQRPESMSKLKSNLIETLLDLYPKLLGGFNITSSSHLIQPKSFWKDPEFSNGPPFLLLIFESPSSNVGLEVTLRLSRYQDSVRVVRIFSKIGIYDHLRLDGWPAAGYISRDGSSGSLVLGKNQDLIELLVKAAIGLGHINIVEEKPQLSLGLAAAGNEEEGHGAAQLPDDNHESLMVKTKEAISSLISSTVGSAGASNIEIPGAIKMDTVSIEDLLHTLRYLLRNEVGLLSKLEGEKLNSFKRFLGILVQFFPADRREVHLFLVQLADWIRPLRLLKIDEYISKLNSLEGSHEPWDVDMNVWEDCRGSVAGRRGYTCGMWRLFHTLTVIALDKHEDSAVLAGIHGYMKEFFGCRECSKHFDSMVERDSALELKSIREQVLWLWKAHNEVNLRLKGTPSEDPAYPKNLYPTLNQCPKCRKPWTADQFDENELINYLISIYSRPKRLSKKYPQHSNSLGSHQSGDHRGSGSGSSSWFGGFWSSTDMGIFMLLYFSIALLLVFAYIHFKVAGKRGIRRYVDPFHCCSRLCWCSKAAATRLSMSPLLSAGSSSSSTSRTNNNF